MRPPKEYLSGFTFRVRQARVAAGFTPGDIATLLRIPEDVYLTYEGPSAGKDAALMPIHLVSLFCTACRVGEGWLLSGRGEGPHAAGNPRPMRAPSAASAR